MVMPMDGHPTWYRYHTLFAEVMHHLAQQRMAGMRGTLTVT
jgi:ATP/maltotriose-dependent transcriptional regulator MalT